MFCSKILQKRSFRITLNDQPYDCNELLENNNVN